MQVSLIKILLILNIKVFYMNKKHQNMK